MPGWWQRVRLNGANDGNNNHTQANTTENQALGCHIFKSSQNTVSVSTFCPSPPSCLFPFWVSAFFLSGCIYHLLSLSFLCPDSSTTQLQGPSFYRCIPRQISILYARCLMCPLCPASRALCPLCDPSSPTLPHPPLTLYHSLLLCDTSREWSHLLKLFLVLPPLPPPYPRAVQNIQRKVDIFLSILIM